MNEVSELFHAKNMKGLTTQFGRLNALLNYTFKFELRSKAVVSDFEPTEHTFLSRTSWNRGVFCSCKLAGVLA